MDLRAYIGLALVAQLPIFEAASVKPTDPSLAHDSIGFEPGGRFKGTDLTLKGLIRIAYNVHGFQISGGPKWMDSDRYDVETRAQGNPPVPEVRLMLEALLADRFKLTLHRENKESPVYWLVVGKKGPKMQRSAKEGGPFRIRRGSVIADTSMASLASLFTDWLDRVVLDKTELSGKYQVRLEWIPEEARPNEPEIASEPGASIFSALQEQLGLKLEARKGPVEMLVIDSAEKPTGN
jgi:uncharacterized protein (TIGR03435 family)